VASNICQSLSDGSGARKGVTGTTTSGEATLMGSLGRRAAAVAAAVALTLSAGADDALAKSVNIAIDSGGEKHVVTCHVIQRVLHPRSRVITDIV